VSLSDTKVVCEPVMPGPHQFAAESGLVQFGQISNVKFQVNLFLKLIDVETRGKAEAFEGQFSGCLKT
jgi:hypothetical protein